MHERWTLSPPDTFLGQIVQETFGRSNLDLPPTMVSSISIYMRLSLIANGGFLSVLPASMLLNQAVSNHSRPSAALGP
jgi:hypothetical protein